MNLFAASDIGRAWTHVSLNNSSKAKQASFKANMAVARGVVNAHVFDHCEGRHTCAKLAKDRQGAASTACSTARCAHLRRAWCRGRECLSGSEEM